jgi:RHS repeat-associated protein
MQLVAVDDSATARYFYDGRGRRIRVLAGGSGRYVYYDQFGRICSEFDGLSRWARDFIYLNGRIIARLEKHYESEPEKMGEALDIDPPPPLPLPIDIDVFYYHTDHLGTPLVMTNDRGNICWKARYYPFGELSYEWVSAANYIRFPGRWEDEETNLYYNWHRYYDPATGRYLQADPIGLAGGMNLYSYVANDPINFADPLGLRGSNCRPRFKKCVGKARVLLGNIRHIGISGAFGKEVIINSCSAAIITSQWCSDKGKLRPFLNQISGKTGVDELFNNIAEVIGGDSPIDGMNVRDALRKLNPNTLIIELPGGEKDLGTVDIEISLPSEMPCPEGTKEAE